MLTAKEHVQQIEILSRHKYAGIMNTFDRKPFLSCPLTIMPLPLYRHFIRCLRVYDNTHTHTHTHTHTYTHARTIIFMHIRTQTQIQSQRYPTTGELQTVCRETRHITFSQSRCVVLLQTAQEQKSRRPHGSYI